ncbi:MAG: hypothetical protein QM689_06330 [Oscillospiraceae bacterium]
MHIITAPLPYIKSLLGVISLNCGNEDSTMNEHDFYNNVSDRTPSPLPAIDPNKVRRRLKLFLLIGLIWTLPLIFAIFSDAFFSVMILLGITFGLYCVLGGGTASKVVGCIGVAITVSFEFLMLFPITLFVSYWFLISGNRIARYVAEAMSIAAALLFGGFLLYVIPDLLADPLSVTETLYCSIGLLYFLFTSVLLIFNKKIRAYTIS